MQNTNVWNAGSNGDSLLCKWAAKCYDESTILHRLAWALVTGQSVKSAQTVLWVSFMLAAQALASLNIAQDYRSRRHKTKIKYTDESAQETPGPIKRSYENARMCSHDLCCWRG